MLAKHTDGTVDCREWVIFGDAVNERASEEVEEAIRNTLDQGVYIFAGECGNSEWVRIACHRAQQRAHESAAPAVTESGIRVAVILPFGSDSVADPTYKVDLAPLLYEALSDEALERDAVVASLRRLADLIESDG